MKRASELDPVSEIKKIISKYLDLEKNQIYIFGSRGRNKETEFSDRDLAIDSTSSAKVSTITLMRLKAALYHSPYSVDLIDLSSVD